MLRMPSLTERQSRILEDLDIHDAEGVLRHYPFRYEHYTSAPFADWKIGETCAFSGILQRPFSSVRFGKGRTMSRGQVYYDGHLLTLTAFNQPWLSRWNADGTVSVVGKYEGKGRMTVQKISQKPLEEFTGWQPVYSLKEGIRPYEFQRIVKKVLEENAASDCVEVVPECLKEKYRLDGQYEAMRKLHFPRSQEDIRQGIRTMKYEEFFRYELVVQSRRQAVRESAAGAAKKFPMEKVEQKIRSLPFSLTQGQRDSLREILADLSAPRVMYRLLEGDVGSGKTVVAELAMYACALAGYQSVLMAPTEILARQHEKSLREFFRGTGIRGAAVYASMDPAQLQQARQGLADGEYAYAVGTHALFQQKMEFSRLGLAITDEQQRFGVQQRSLLSAKGEMADVLMMSATPIPRTLAAAVYGDMDISVIGQMPSGRKPVHTKVVLKNSLTPFQKELEGWMERGDQAYLVCPSIEEGASGSRRRNVTLLYENLKKEWQGRFRVGYVHGKMKAAEKDAVMEGFRRREYQALVTTTVVEVGVDVPDANVMVVYNAECFGLSQLHQLRGRIARHGGEGHCYLLTSSKDPAVKERLEFLASHTDGFQIAQYDLEKRGPGDLLGTRQSGMPGFILGELFHDQNILQASRSDAVKVLADVDAYPAVREYLQGQGTRPGEIGRKG